MCGIVAAVGKNKNVDVVATLVEGLQRLEYRGYDSCGLALLGEAGLQRTRSTARVAQLREQVHTGQLCAPVGIAHTRWATHGAPAVCNAHPHFSFGPGVDTAQAIEQTQRARVAIVHNGIIENHETLRAQLTAQGYRFASQTDTEVIVHLIDSLYTGDLFAAVAAARAQLHGAYAIAVLHADEPQRIVGARAGSPLVLGFSDAASDTSGHFLASDALAIAGAATSVIYLQEGDIVDITPEAWRMFDANNAPLSAAQRPRVAVPAHAAAVELGPYRHYMQKEIFEQPRAIAETMEGIERITPALFDGPQTRAADVFAQTDRVLILACGTSYYSGCVAKYWLEAIAGVPCSVEVASEYRWRTSVAEPRTLVVTISQSGETADTLSALRHAQSLGLSQTLAICNVATSALVRECALRYLTRAGVEIGVASTKAFTTQLVALFLLTLALAQSKARLSDAQHDAHLTALRHLSAALQSVLALEPQIISWAQRLASHKNALFLGRGTHFPIAQEGALKLKEISYIHAEAYPAGELKHGPLALIDAHMPVLVVAPNDALLEKLKSNMEEVRARAGVLYVLADANATVAAASAGMHVIRMPEHYGALSPILHTVPLQLLAYHTALALGTDVDKPRNLAKSVTVE